MNGYEGAGAGRVDDHAGAVKAEGVGNAAGDDAEIVAGTGVGIDLGGERKNHARIVAVAESEEDAGAMFARADRIVSGIFESFPGDFESEALLGIHGDGFARRNAEEMRIEERRIAEEGTVARGHFAGGVGIGIVKAR